MSSDQGDMPAVGSPPTSEPSGSGQSKEALGDLLPPSPKGASADRGDLTAVSAPTPRSNSGGSDNQDILTLANRYRRECEDSYYKHVTKAEAYASQHYGLGVPLVISTALAGISSVGSVANANSLPWLNVVIIASALLSAVLAPLQTFLNLSDRGVKHQAAAAGYDGLKNRIDVFFLRYPTPASVVRAEAVEELKKFAADLADLKLKSPSI